MLNPYLAGERGFSVCGLQNNQRRRRRSRIDRLTYLPSCSPFPTEMQLQASNFATQPHFKEERQCDTCYALSRLAARLIDPKTPPLRCPNKCRVPLPFPCRDVIIPAVCLRVGGVRSVGLVSSSTSAAPPGPIGKLSISSRHSPLSLPPPTSFLLLLHLVKVGDRLDRLAAPWPFVD